jgi:uncharacterized membrane protein (DUF2068 family)
VISQPREREDACVQASAPTQARHDRLLPWIAAERTVRAIVLLSVGAVLVTHPHANWADEITRLAERLGLDPRSNWIRRLMNDVRKIDTHEDVFFGAVALAYGALESAEAYGLWRRRRWGEWLTVIATSLLLVPEIWELTRSATPLKVGALLVNLAVVAYLLWRLRSAKRSCRRALRPRSARPSKTHSGP